MDRRNERAALELLNEMAWGFARTRVLTTAVKAGFLDFLAQGPASATEVAAAQQTDPEMSGKFLRVLVAMGILQVQGDRFSLPEPFRQLFDPESPRYYGHALLHSHHLYVRWGEMLEPLLREGRYEATPPRTGEAQKQFAAAMRSIGSNWVQDVAELLDLSHCSKMLDVGGGVGHYSIALCQRWPQLHSTICDRPEVVAGAREEIAAHHLEGRIDTLGGDYHDVAFEANYDLVLLANILHQERPEGARQLVERCARALRPRGQMAVVDFTMDADRCGPLHGTLFAINMREFGDTYPFVEIQEWMSAAGLQHIRCLELSPTRWTVLALKP